MKNDNLGRYDLDAYLQTLGEPTVTFCGKTFDVNKSFKNYKKVESLVAKEPENSLEIMVGGVLGKEALEHLKANEETISIVMMKELPLYIAAAVSGETVEEVKRRFRG